MRYSIATFLCVASINVHANVLQYFTGLSYSNPAELFKVKKNDFIIGGTVMYADIDFKGRQFNFNTSDYDVGSSDSKQTSLLPYGRIANRLNDKLVFGVDVTEPFHSNLKWGPNAVTRYASTETLMTDIDVSPRASVSLSQSVYIGGGLNFNFLKNNEANWALPSGETTYNTLINRSYGFGLGADIGLYYMFNKTNFFGAAYYSSIKQKARGESLFGLNINTNHKFYFRMPATTILSYTHLFSKDWLINLLAYRSEWNANQIARVRDTAAPPPTPKDFAFNMKYDVSWAFVGLVRHQISEKTGLALISAYDDGPEQPQYRPLNFPSDKQYLLGFVADYKATATTSLQLLYAHVISNTIIGNRTNFRGNSIPFTTGRVQINADVVDLRLLVQV
ncbi:OmpP1/FadL family transporter [Legionella sp. D16C41]|uniref:OmpP1/FadL family transporter n=1 Tax=Legionella sp. D16C41 TaxID=3402688 RepID=UPI003AF4E102